MTERIDPEDIIKRIKAGIELRERGGYEEAMTLLKAAFDESLEGGLRTSTINSGLNLSILYRLVMGREVRAGNKIKAKDLAEKSLRIFEDLKNQDLLDEKDPNKARNLSHAYLYAGKIDKAIPALERSISLQDSLAAKGDEFCHLAAAYLAQGYIRKEDEFVDRGIELITENEGSPIWQTFGLMTKASFLSKSGDTEKALEVLNRAKQLSQEEKLLVRLEEIDFMLQQPPDRINVLDAVTLI